MGCNNHGPFIQRHTESVRITDRLIFADETEFISDVAEERQFPFGQCPIEGFIAQISRIELLCVGQHFHQCGAGIGATMNFFDCIAPLWID